MSKIRGQYLKDSTKLTLHVLNRYRISVLGTGLKEILEEALGPIWKNLGVNIGLGSHPQMAQILMKDADLQYMGEAFRVQLVVLI